jgi:hypothetical protein
MNQANEIQQFNTDKNKVVNSSPLESVDIGLAPKDEFSNENPALSNLKSIKGFIETVDAIPTYTPKNFYESIKLYNGQLYIYDIRSESWLETNAQPITYASGTDEVNGSGTITVSGLTFQPRFLRITSYPVDTEQSESTGSVTNVSASVCIFKYWDGTKLVSGLETANDYLIVIFDNGGSSSTLVKFVSFNSDGFTLNCTTYSNDVRYLYEVW